MERRGMSVCRDCMLLLRQSKSTTQWRLATATVWQGTRRSFNTSNAPWQFPRRQTYTSQRNIGIQNARSFSTTNTRRADVQPKGLKTFHNRILELSSSAISPEDNTLPSEQRVLYVLEQLESIAHNLLDGKDDPRVKAANRTEPDTTATSALLGSVNARQYPAFLSKIALLNLISEKSEEILRHADVFITPAILKSYVTLQTLLQQPSSFPDIFTLYASKPVPKLASGHIEYTGVSPDKINAAVDSKTANTALSSAIASHNLPLCIDIINTTFCTPSFKKSKLLRQAGVPALFLLAAPVTAYVAADQFSLFQTTMDPGYATTVAFAGIMTYIATVSGLGYVVITTANDQMDRVTWAKGVPLWERWIREEERAALDRVAGKWGFQIFERRGEEEGEEWEGLREFVGMRGMVLDRVELMEGME